MEHLLSSAAGTLVKLCLCYLPLLYSSCVELVGKAHRALADVVLCERTILFCRQLYFNLFYGQLYFNCVEKSAKKKNYALQMTGRDAWQSRTILASRSTHVF